MEDSQNQAAFDTIFKKHGPLKIITKLQQTILDDQFKICGKLSDGSFGEIYHGINLFNDEQIVIKFVQEHDLNDVEVKVLKEIRQKTRVERDLSNIPKMYTSGKVLITDPEIISKKQYVENNQQQNLENQIWSYFVQEKFGNTLEHYLYEKDQPFSVKTTFQVGMQLLDRLRVVHEAGFLYCDLKMDNIVVGDYMGSNLHKLYLIDYGLAKSYLGSDGKHMPHSRLEFFTGNMMYGSKYLLNFESPSRRDDLISLCYVLLYIIEGSLPFMEVNLDHLSSSQQFRKLKQLKYEFTPEKLCQSPDTMLLLPFIQQVFSLEFDEEPEYAKLRFTLLKVLLELEETPTNVYDWNCFEQNPLQIIPLLISDESLEMSVVDEDATIAHVNQSIQIQKMNK